MNAVGKVWTPEEIRFLCENYNKISNGKIADALGRTSNAIEKKVSVFGLAKKRDFDEIRRQVRDLWGKVHPHKIASDLGIDKSTVFGFAKQMNLGKSGFASGFDRAEFQSQGTKRSNELRATFPTKPKPVTAEQRAWAIENFNSEDPELRLACRMIARKVLYRV